MSVAFTEDAVRNRTKTVTRRKGWKFLEPGDRLTLCRKVMGRKPGEPLVRIVDVEVLAVHQEQLVDLMNRPEYAAEEMAREGFPGMSPHDFVNHYFVLAQGMKIADFVTRIEWRYLEQGAS